MHSAAQISQRRGFILAGTATPVVSEGVSVGALGGRLGAYRVGPAGGREHSGAQALHGHARAGGDGAPDGDPAG